MQIANNILKKIVIKYLNDSISKEDWERLKLWLAKKPKNHEKFKDFVRLNHEINLIDADVDVEGAYRKVLQEIEQKSKPNRKMITSWLKYAALLVGVSFIGYGIYKSQNVDGLLDNKESQIVLELEDGTTQIVNEGQNIVINNANGKTVTEQKNKQLVYSSQDSAAQVLKYNTLKVPHGKTFGVVLSDGSKVMLNAGTELKYPVEFIQSEKNRTVYLNGEAYFEVSKNEAHLFIVETHDMDVEVLGTQFNVTSYDADDKAYTVLVSGSVAAHNKLAELDSKVIEPNQKVYFEDDHLKVEQVDVEKYVAWVYGQLVFVDDSFNVITNKLERRFDVKINNQYPDLNNLRITGTFKNESIEEVLETFKTYKSFDYTIKDKIITLVKSKQK